MLTLRDDQMKALGAHLVAKFRNERVRHIQARYPQHYQNWGDAGVREFVDRAIVASEKWNLETEGAVGVLIELMLEYGEDFEKHADREWALKFLEHPELPGPVKVTAIRERFANGTNSSESSQQR